MYGEFRLTENLDKARAIFGEAIGRCPKKNIFNAYISIEYQLGEFNRCRRFIKIIGKFSI